MTTASTKPNQHSAHTPGIIAPMSKGEMRRLDYWGVSGDRPAVLPLSIDKHGMIVNAQGGDVAMMYGPKECRAHNAARIVACVNACEGISTDYLEAGIGGPNALSAAKRDVDQYRDERDALRARVAALEAALTTLVASLEWEEKRSGTTYNGYDEARAALAGK